MNMKLKELRISKGINQEKLASYCNVSRSTVAMWETNKAQPDIETLKKLAEYFETSIDYLTGRTDYTDFENETICENLKTYLGKGTFMYQNDGRTYYPNYETTRSILKGSHKFTKESLSIYLETFNLTEEDLLESKKEKPAENDELEDKNVKFIGRDGTVKFKKLSPEMIAMLEQLPDSGDDLE